MAVAKSYVGLEIVKEPYLANGRMYVQVKMGNGNIKQVRWYSEAEYVKYYGEKPAVADTIKATQKDSLGFAEGYITIFKGNTFSVKEWMKEHGAIYHDILKWHMPGGMEIPELPTGIEAVRLDWELVGEGTELKNSDIVQTVFETLTCDPGTSEFQGEIGETIEVEVEVTNVFHLDYTRFGRTNIHTMMDEDGNVYVWRTASKDWEVGSRKVIRGTVKEHNVYRNVKQTRLTRCKEVGVK